MAAAPVFASASEAMVMVHAALGYLATADATAMTAGERARRLRELEQADSVATAVRTSVLGLSPRARTTRTTGITVRARG